MLDWTQFPARPACGEARSSQAGRVTRQCRCGRQPSGGGTRGGRPAVGDPRWATPVTSAIVAQRDNVAGHDNVAPGTRWRQGCTTGPRMDPIPARMASGPARSSLAAPAARQCRWGRQPCRNGRPRGTPAVGDPAMGPRWATRATPAVPDPPAGDPGHARPAARDPRPRSPRRPRPSRNPGSEVSAGTIPR